MTFLSIGGGTKAQIPWAYDVSISFCMATCQWGIWEACLNVEGSDESIILARKVKLPMRNDYHQLKLKTEFLEKL